MTLILTTSLKNIEVIERDAASDDYKKDAQGRRYRNVANDGFFQQGNTSMFNKFRMDPEVFLADDSIVVPRFLIVIGQK